MQGSSEIEESHTISVTLAVGWGTVTAGGRVGEPGGQIQHYLWKHCCNFAAMTEKLVFLKLKK